MLGFFSPQGYAMTSAAFFFPVLLQVLLTLVLYIALAMAKSRAVRTGQVNLERRALHADAWPESVIRINNNIRNQFEVPVLFYVLTFVLWQMQFTGSLTQGLSWLFVVSRIAHAYVHTGSNYVPLRRRVFMLGVVIVAFLLATAILQVFAAIGKAPSY